MNDQVDFDTMREITLRGIKQRDLRLEFEENKFGINWYSFE